MVPTVRTAAPVYLCVMMQSVDAHEHPPVATAKRGDVARCWFITINNPSSLQIEFCRALEQEVGLQAASGGLERAPTTGTVHLHVAVSFAKTMGFSAVTAMFSRNGTHANVQKVKSWEHAKEYATKDGDILVEFDRRSPGKRTDIDELVTTVREGGLMLAYEKCPVMLVRYPSGARLLDSLRVPPARPNIRVFTLYGPAGCGKTRWANAQFPGAWTYCKTGSRDSTFFDGYRGQTEIVFDDFLGECTLPIGIFLQLISPSPITVGVKGGSVPFFGTTFVFTTNLPIANWYERHPDQAAILRRTVRDLGREVPRVNGEYIAATEVQF